jgi:hypothetical protein
LFWDDVCALAHSQRHSIVAIPLCHWFIIEWGEGTAVESSTEWDSSSGYGQYLDCLHDPQL